MTERTPNPKPVESLHDDPLWADPNVQRFLDVTAQALKRARRPVIPQEGQKAS